MCDKAANRRFFFQLILHIIFESRYKNHEMCNSIISEDPFSIRYVPDQYKTHHICDKAVDDCLTALKFVPNWFKYTLNILYFNEEFGNVVFSCNEMCIINIDLHDINLDDTTYAEDDHDSYQTFSLAY